MQVVMLAIRWLGELSCREPMVKQNAQILHNPDTNDVVVFHAFERSQSNHPSSHAKGFSIDNASCSFGGRWKSIENHSGARMRRGTRERGDCAFLFNSPTTLPIFFYTPLASFVCIATALMLARECKPLSYKQRKPVQPNCPQ